MTSAQVTGHFSRSPAYHLRKSGLDHIDHLEAMIARLDAQIEAMMAP